MKQINLFKKAVLLSAVAAMGANVSNAQVHPLAFGPVTIGTNTSPGNWYADYVGLRLEVIDPASVAGDKVYTTANNGDATNTSNWAGYPATPLVDLPIVMPQTGDSCVENPITTNMTGKVALVYRGDNVFFGDKAFGAQQAGAVACIIVNNVAGGPVGMAVGGSGSSVTIPVFMISKADGDALDVLYNAGTVAHVTITTWGGNLQNDLGFVPGGIAGWHQFAIPVNQLTSSGNPIAYKGMDGAFIANYGSNPATNVKVNATLKFNGSSIHTSNSGTLATFSVADSIYAMFAPSDYNLPAESGTGRYDIFYQIVSDSVDQYPNNDTATYSFYATDSVYCKSRYDFATQQPFRTIYESFGGGTEFLWGNMFYVANAGNSISTVQYSMAMNSTSPGYPNFGTANNIYLFKWVDGYTDAANSITFPHDSIIQNGELLLVSAGVNPNSGAGDTSEALLTCRTMGDSLGNGNHPNLDANSWYYIAIDIPATSTTPLFLGCDGILDDYPRIYGRFYNTTDHFMENSNLVEGGDETYVWSNASINNSACPSTWTNFVNTVDSFNYSSMKGLIPSIGIITGPEVVAAVKNTNSSVADVNIYPNPATDYLHVAVNLHQPAKKVVYELIDGLARFVNKEVHTNVTSEVNTIATNKLAAGTYYMIITIDDSKVITKRFTVLK